MYVLEMRIIARKTLSDHWSKQGRKDSEQPLRAWFAEVERSQWQKPADLKAQFLNASILKDGRVVFNIAGNKYRLVAWINYSYRVLYIRFVGTHEEYDSIDAQEI
jgi:mRNA interferase HigB